MKKLITLIKNEFFPPPKESAFEMMERLEREAEERYERRPDDDTTIEIIIVSDNHGDTWYLEQLRRFHKKADYFVHCGDSNLKPDHPELANMTVVKGNTDYTLPYQDDEFVTVANDEKLMITHGHRFLVGYGRQKLIDYAKNLPTPPNIVLYGHTHIVEVDMLDDVLIINPGSISDPRDETPPSYAKLTIMEENYQVKLYRAADNVVIKEWLFLRSTRHLCQNP